VRYRADEPLPDTRRSLVIGADLTRASLLLAQGAARRFGLTRVQFVETDLRRPGLRAGAFDVVFASGVLHHTPNPRASFCPHRRVGAARGDHRRRPLQRIRAHPAPAAAFRRPISGYRWIPFDPVLRERDDEPARREAWLRDQYQHPEEHRHTLGEVQNWFNENGIEYVRAYPSALIGETPDDLLTAAGDTWSPEAWLAQLGWMRSLGHEGGLFVTVGRRTT